MRGHRGPMMLRLVAATLASVVLLSGCAVQDPGVSGAAPLGGDGQNKPADAGNDKPTSVDAGTGSGSLAGQVLTQEMEPLAGAAAQVVSSEDPTDAFYVASDATGKFVVEGLREGRYAVYVSMTGYDSSKVRSVQIKPGETTEAKIVLVKVAVAEPYHESTSFHTVVTDYWTMYGASGSGGGRGGLSGRNPIDGTTYTPTHQFRANESGFVTLQSVIVQAKWTPTVTACKFGVRTDVYSPEQDRGKMDQGFGDSDAESQEPTNPYHWDNKPNVNNPTYLQIQREGDPVLAMLGSNRTELNGGSPIGIQGNWTTYTSLYPVDMIGVGVQKFSCAFYQRIETWVSRFFVEPAAAGWSVFEQG